MQSKEKPYVLFVAELIYLEICDIKKKNIDFSNITAIESFIGSELYKEISSGKFHDQWLKKLKENNFIDAFNKATNHLNSGKVYDHLIKIQSS